MAEELERRVARLEARVMVAQAIAVLGVMAALATYVHGRWKSTQRVPAPKVIALRGEAGTVELGPTGLLLRDAGGRLRAELSVSASGTHLVLSDGSGRAATQLTAAAAPGGADQAALSVLSLGVTGEAQTLLRAGAGGLTVSDGATDRVRLGFADTRAELALASTDGKQAATLAAQPGTDPALLLRDEVAKAHLRVSLGGGAPAIELQDDAKGDGAVLGAARLKIGGAEGKEKVVTP